MTDDSERLQLLLLKAEEDPEWAKAVATELKTSQKQLMDLHLGVAQRWSLSLAVGNGGGLLAVIGQVLAKPDAPMSYLLFPSAICFALGLCAVGLTHAAGTWRMDAGVSEITADIRAFDAKDGSLVKKRRPKLMASLYRAEVIIELVSGALFTGAVFYPLGVLFHRLVTEGTFTP